MWILCMFGQQCIQIALTNPNTLKVGYLVSKLLIWPFKNTKQIKVISHTISDKRIKTAVVNHYFIRIDCDCFSCSCTIQTVLGAIRLSK